MKRLVWTIIGVLGCQGIVQGQPRVDQGALRRMLPDDAVVLNPAGAWESVNWPGSPDSQVAGMDEVAGHPRMVVAEPGKSHTWKRTLAIPFDPQRYPIAVLTYRASGSVGSNARILWLDDTTGPAKGGINVFYNGELIADGEVQEIVADLRKRTPKGEIVALRVYPFCQGPEPAVFELLGLRFESEHDLPPLEQKAEPDITLRVLGEGRAPIEGAVVTVDAERVNWSRSAKTDAAGKVTLRAVSNPFDKHVLRITKEGMVPVDVRMSSEGELPDTVRMVPGVPHSGVVVSEEGEPVPNASVEMRMQAVFADKEAQRTFRVLTDAAGRWQFRMMPKRSKGAWFTLRHPDYVPGKVTTPPLKAIHDGTAKLVIRRGTPVRGRVLLADGGPAQGAVAILYSLGGGYVIVNCVPPTQHLTPSVETGADGSYWFPAREKSWRLVVLHKTGYAECNPEQHAESPDLKLQPWGRIEGVCRIGDKPMPNTRITIAPFLAHGQNSPGIPHQFKATTDGEGRFVFERVPPGKGTVGINTHRIGKVGFTGHGQRFDLAPGRVFLAQIGGTGRPVIGQLAAPKGATAKMIWAETHGRLTALAVPPTAKRDKHAVLLEIANLPPAERSKRFREWRKSAQGKSFAEDQARKAPAAPQPQPTEYEVTVAANGAFRIEDIPAGSYRLRLRVRTGGSTYAIKHEFTVPDMEGRRSDEPLNLGKLPVKLK